MAPQAATVSLIQMPIPADAHRKKLFRHGIRCEQCGLKVFSNSLQYLFYDHSINMLRTFFAEFRGSQRSCCNGVLGADIARFVG
jgi:hypothetical protein